jgi:hypothetical protein
MNEVKLPEFESYEEEAAFWDNLDTADLMPDDGEWFRFETDNKRAVRIAILPQIAEALAERARAQGVTVETLVNAFLMERLHGTAAAAE